MQRYIETGLQCLLNKMLMLIEMKWWGQLIYRQWDLCLCNHLLLAHFNGWVSVNLSSRLKSCRLGVNWIVKTGKYIIGLYFLCTLSITFGSNAMHMICWASGGIWKHTKWPLPCKAYMLVPFGSKASIDAPTAQSRVIKLGHTQEKTSLQSHYLGISPTLRNIIWYS